MTESQVNDFRKRVRGIDRKHRRFSRGYVQLVERDGLLLPQKARMRRPFPFGALVFVIVSFLVFKGFLFSQIGAVHYDERIKGLNNGMALEQVGAWAMQGDPLSRMIASWFPKLL